MKTSEVRVDMVSLLGEGCQSYSENEMLNLNVEEEILKMIPALTVHKLSPHRTPSIKSIT